jgi:autotransporter-associated beta strand protein
MMNTRHAVIAMAICLSAIADAAAANDCKWTGNGLDNKWSTIDNWIDCGDVAPQPGDTLTFNDLSARPANVNDIDGLTVRTILIAGLGGGPDFDHWSITGKPLTITESLTAFAPVDATNHGPSFLAPIVLGSAGASLLIDTGNHTDVPLAPLELGDIDLAGSSIRFRTENPVIVTGHISGAGDPRRFAIFKQGTSDLTLHDNSYTGLTVIDDGSLIAASSQALGAHAVENDETFVVDDGVLVLANGIVLDETIGLDGHARIIVAAGESATIAGGLVDASGVFDGEGTLTITGPVQGNAVSPLAESGGGTLILSNPGNALAAFLVKAGTLRAGAPGAISSGTDLTLSSGDDAAVLDLNGIDVTIRTLTGTAGGRILLGARTLTINQSTDLTTESHTEYDGTITGTGGLVKTGPGALLLAGDQSNTYTGTTTVQAGKLALGKSSPNTAIAGPFVISGGVLADGVSQLAVRVPVIVNAPGLLRLDLEETVGSLTGDGHVLIGGATLTIGGDNTSTTFAGILSGAHIGPGPSPQASFRLVKVGAGALTLTGQLDLGDQAVVDAGTPT